MQSEENIRCLKDVSVAIRKCKTEIKITEWQKFIKPYDERTRIDFKISKGSTNNETMMPRRHVPPNVLEILWQRQSHKIV